MAAILLLLLLLLLLFLLLGDWDLIPNSDDEFQIIFDCDGIGCDDGCPPEEDRI